LAGGLGNDVIFGGRGTDNLTGNAGADSINGGAGADTISGGDGNDLLINVGTGANGAAADAMTGGLGNDTFEVRGSVASGVPATIYGTAAFLSDFSVSGTNGIDVLRLSPIAANYSSAYTGFSNSVAAANAGSTVVMTLGATSVGTALSAGTDIVQLTSNVAAGATLQAMFNSAIGTSTVTGLDAGSEMFFSLYDTTNSRMVIGAVDAGSSGTASVIEANDTVRLVSTASMTAAQYAAFTNANLAISTLTQDASLIGTTGDDAALAGSAGADVISALDGADGITGGGGDDIISTGAGADVINFSVAGDTDIVLDFTVAAGGDIIDASSAGNNGLGVVLVAQVADGATGTVTHDDNTILFLSSATFAAYDTKAEIAAAFAAGAEFAAVAEADQNTLLISAADTGNTYVWQLIEDGANTSLVDAADTVQLVGILSGMSATNAASMVVGNFQV
jgi:Ca2+-binding RTX toxin-like protein